ncbi:MAG: hypothetical protein AAF696_30420 [Bacteroidota bacterium]
MKTKNIVIFLATVFLGFNSCLAQVSGYLGKKFILKSDLSSFALEEGYSVELEAALFRDRSISLEYSQRSKTHISPYYDEEFDFITELDTTQFTSNTLTLKIRSYLNKSISAPKGAYSLIHARYGKTKMIRGREQEIDPGFGRDAVRLYDQIIIENANFFQLGLGWGYQAIMADRFTLDAAWVFVFSGVEPGIKYKKRFVKDRSTIYGSNLYSISRPYGVWGGMNVGISAYLALGVLLF